MLFKYLPDNRIDVIKNLKIRFSPLKSLNDPYEALFSIDVSREVRGTIAKVSKELDDEWNQLPVQDKIIENQRKYERNLAAIKEGVNSSLNSEIAGENLINTLGEDFGILSLSRSHTSLLMWAHYASDNTGYVIGFDEAKLFLNQNDLEGNHVYPYKVSYSDNRQFVKFGESNWKEKLLCQKPIEWAYEQEERFFLSGMDLSTSKEKDKFGAKIVLYDFSPTSILKIFLGCKASCESRERIINAVKKNSLNCAVYQATVSKTEYKLNFEQIHA
ncbi:MAG: DUF2971 domain-containing protein [Leadbetterella sp.]|nr:DUF2971 domain-containing protein [Leadbetterella sp.]